MQMTTHYCFFAFPVIFFLILIPLYDCRKNSLIFLVLDKSPCFQHCKTETELNSSNAKGDKSKTGQSQNTFLTNISSPLRVCTFYMGLQYFYLKILGIRNFITNQFCCTYTTETGSTCTKCIFSGTWN